MLVARSSELVAGSCRDLERDSIVILINTSFLRAPEPCATVEPDKAPSAQLGHIPFRRGLGPGEALHQVPDPDMRENS